MRDARTRESNREEQAENRGAEVPRSVEHLRGFLIDKGWSLSPPIPLDGDRFGLADHGLAVWEVDYAEPTMVLFATRDTLDRATAFEDARRLCRLTPGRSMLLLEVGTASNNWALSVCPTWKEKIRTHVERFDGWSAATEESLAVFRETTDALEAVVRLTVLLDKRETSAAFFRAIEQKAGDLDGAWRSPDELDAKQRRELTIQLLCRLLFIYFIERKGWLSDSPNWFLRRVLGGRRAGIWRDCLRSLFFDALNTPREERVDDRWGDVPFLNGGLFEPSPLELRHPDLDLDDAVIRSLIVDVLERFRFVDSESRSVRAAIDPEMLGIVFERLMNAEQRSRSGAFFTPPSIARKHVQDVLDAWLSDTSTLPKERDVRAMRLLDPACGSGSFLLAALHAIERRTLESTDESEVDLAVLRRRIVNEQLFGIDISPVAVRVTELRLWLAIVDALPDGITRQPEPLPNLGFNLFAGDFLLESGVVPGTRFRPSVAGERSADDAVIHRARRRFVVSHGTSKLHARRSLERHLQSQALAQLDGYLESLESTAEQLRLTGVIEDSSSLSDSAIDGRKTPVETSDELAVLIDEVRAQRAAIADGERAGGFCASLHLADVLGSGGFDAVIGNPPWVRWTDLPVVTRDALRRRYRVAQGDGLYGSQPDLSYVFIERAHEVTRADGVVGMLVTAKLLRSESGVCARRYILRESTLVEVNDYSRRGEQIFAAGAYTMFLLVRARPGQGGVSVRIRSEASTITVPHETFVDTFGHHGNPWLLSRVQEEEPALRVRDVSRSSSAGVRRQAVRLGDRKTVRYGIKTGKNAVYINPPFSDAATVPLLRGRDICGDTFTTSDRLLFPHDTVTGEVLPEPGDTGVAAYLRAHRADLEARSDWRSTTPFWSLFRVRSEALGHRVAWADISKQLDPVYLPPVSLGGPVPLNSVYYVAVADEAEADRLLEWLRSSGVRREAAERADTALNGYRRYRAAVVGSLMIPESLLASTGQGDLKLANSRPGR